MTETDESPRSESGVQLARSAAQCVEAALAARQVLEADDSISSYRVFNGRADGIAGLVIERFGPVLVVQLHEGRLKLGPDQVRPIAEGIHERLGTRAVYKKVFVQDRSHVSPAAAAARGEAEPWLGQPVEPEQIITEYDLRFIIRPYDGLAAGLFLEHRDNRRRIHDLAAGRRVLNAFAYTCGFSVAAAAGKAACVASVDLSKRYLEWGKRNFAANNIDTAAHRFFRCDLFDFYKRAKRQGRRFDLIILDPPTFSRARRPRRVFSLAEHLPQLCAETIALLDPDGLVFLATNHRQTSRSRLEEELTAAAPHRPCTVIERPPLPADFAGDPDYSKSIIARFD